MFRLHVAGREGERFEKAEGQIEVDDQGRLRLR